MELAGKDNWQAFTLVSPAHKPYAARVEEMRSLVGVKVEKPDYEKALRLINEESKLGLDEKDLKVMTLIYRALSSNARRFGNEKLLAEEHRGNSASHSLMAILRLDERLQGLPHTPELAGIRHEAALGVLMHDVGELCGEFSSVAQRIDNASLKEQPALEGLIVRHGLALAAQAVETGDERRFFDGIESLKAEIKTAGEQVKRGVKFKSVKEILDAHALPELEPEDYFRVNNLAHVYERAESGVGFVPHLIKNAEHTQGLRHLLHFMEQGNFEGPLTEMNSRRIVGGMKYVESSLGDMCYAAVSPLQKQIARRWRDLMYESTIAYLEKAAPLIDRDGPAQEASGHGPERVQHVIRLREKHRLDRSVHRDGHPEDRPGGDALFPVETNLRLRLLYRKAIDTDYLPRPGEILGTMPELPKELRGLYANRAALGASAR